MGEILKIGKALYEEEEQNKRKIDGFTKIFRYGRRKKFRYQG